MRISQFENPEKCNKAPLATITSYLLESLKDLWVLLFPNLQSARKVSESQVLLTWGLEAEFFTITR